MPAYNVYNGMMPRGASIGDVAYTRRQRSYLYYERCGGGANVWVKPQEGEYVLTWREGGWYIDVWFDDLDLAHDYAIKCLAEYYGHLVKMYGPTGHLRPWGHSGK